MSLEKNFSRLNEVINKTEKEKNPPSSWKYEGGIKNFAKELGDKSYIESIEAEAKEKYEQALKEIDAEKANDMPKTLYKGDDKYKSGDIKAYAEKLEANGQESYTNSK